MTAVNIQGLPQDVPAKYPDSEESHVSSQFWGFPHPACRMHFYSHDAGLMLFGPAANQLHIE